jgi:hypothetical protein
MVFYSLTYDVNRLCLIYKRKKNMHNLPIEFGAAALLVWGVLQSLSVLLTHLDTASKQIEARSNWTAPDGTLFEEVALEQFDKSGVMQHEFEQIRSDAFLPGHLRHANG